MTQRLSRLGAIALAGALGAACASKSPDPYYVLVAEALTAPTLTEAMRVAPRMFTSFQLLEACRTIRPVERFETPYLRLGLRVGERFPLSALNVVAVNGADIAVPDVPVAIEAEELSPPLARLTSDDPDLAAGRLHALAEGSFRIRVRTICGTRPVETILTARIDDGSE